MKRIINYRDGCRRYFYVVFNYSNYYVDQPYLFKKRNVTSIEGNTYDNHFYNSSGQRTSLHWRKKRAIKQIDEIYCLLGLGLGLPQKLNSTLASCSQFREIWRAKRFMGMFPLIFRSKYNLHLHNGQNNLWGL